VHPRGAANIAAFIAAALLAVHPVMTEAVGYVSARSEVLCTTFFLLALLAGRSWIRGAGVGAAVAMIALWIASLATKETAAVFPFVFAAYDRLSRDRDDPGARRRFISVHFPLMAMTVLAGVVRAVILWRVEYPGQVAVRWSLAGMTLDVFRRYVLLLLVPVGQAAFHGVFEIQRALDPHVIEAVLLIAAAAGAIWECRRRAWVVSFGLLWFVVALVPSSLLVLIDRAEPMAEHRLYLASCGLFLVAGVAIQQLWIYTQERLPHSTWLMAAAVALLLMAFSLDTMARNVRWSDPVRLWSEAVDRSPDHFWPRLLLGEALMQSERPIDALQEFETAVRLAPSLSEPYAKVGVCLITVGRPAEARAYLDAALERDPGNQTAQQGIQLLQAHD
jgi:hypothetical protein